MMTFAQLVASSGDPDWRAVAEGLIAILLGLLAWFGRRVVRTVDEAVKKIDEWGDRIHKWNQTNTSNILELEGRMENLETTVDRRRKPRP